MNKNLQIIKLYNKEYSIRRIAKELKIDRNRISKILKNNNIPIRNQKFTSRKFFCNDYYFEKINTPDKAYWLGFIMADGCILSKRKNESQKFGITLSVKDKNHLKLLNKCLNSTYEIKTYIGSGYNKTGQFSRLIITSQILVDCLKNYGIIENKTLICKFPSNLDDKYYLDFVRGYLDGDGSICQLKNNQYSVNFTGTYDVLNNIKKILKINNKITFNNKNSYELKFGGNFKVLKILKEIYENKNIKLERKYKIYLKLKKYIER